MTDVLLSLAWPTTIMSYRPFFVLTPARMDTTSGSISVRRRGDQRRLFPWQTVKQRVRIILLRPSKTLKKVTNSPINICQWNFCVLGHSDHSTPSTWSLQGGWDCSSIKLSMWRMVVNDGDNNLIIIIAPHSLYFPSLWSFSPVISYFIGRDNVYQQVKHFIDQHYVGGRSCERGGNSVLCGASLYCPPLSLPVLVWH